VQGSGSEYSALQGSKTSRWLQGSKKLILSSPKEKTKRSKENIRRARLGYGQTCQHLLHNPSRWAQGFPYPGCQLSFPNTKVHVFNGI